MKSLIKILRTNCTATETKDLQHVVKLLSLELEACRAEKIQPPMPDGRVGPACEGRVEMWEQLQNKTKVFNVSYPYLHKLRFRKG